MGIAPKIIFALEILTFAVVANAEDIHKNLINNTRIIKNVSLMVSENIHRNLKNSTSTAEKAKETLSPQETLINENIAKHIKDKLRRKAQSHRWGPERNPWKGMKTLEFGRGTYGGIYGSKVPGFIRTPIDKIRNGSPKDIFIGSSYNNKGFSFANMRHGGLPLVKHTDGSDSHRYYDGHENNHYRQYVGNARSRKSIFDFDRK